MEINFRKIEESRAGKVYLNVVYMGGDADTSHPEEILLDGITFDNIGEKTEEIAALIKPYVILQDLLDVNSSSYTENYADVLEEHGEEIAKLFDNVPGDPTTDFQYNCSIRYIELVGYDSTGARHKSAIDLR